jgi:hypothetical protein
MALPEACCDFRLRAFPAPRIRQFRRYTYSQLENYLKILEKGGLVDISKDHSLRPSKSSIAGQWGHGRSDVVTWASLFLIVTKICGFQGVKRHKRMSSSTTVSFPFSLLPVFPSITITITITMIPSISAESSVEKQPQRFTEDFDYNDYPPSTSEYVIDPKVEARTMFVSFAIQTIDHERCRDCLITFSFRRKVDWTLIPILGALYSFALIGRSTSL